MTYNMKDWTREVQYELIPWLTFTVWENGDVWSPDAVWSHPMNWAECRRAWVKLSFSDNWAWYKVANISALRFAWRDWIGKKARTISISQHKLVYVAFNGMDYWWDFKVWHLDWNPSNNSLWNLYCLYDKDNTEKKSKAYKLLEMVMRWELELTAEQKVLLWL